MRVFFLVLLDYIISFKLFLLVTEHGFKCYLTQSNSTRPTKHNLEVKCGINWMFVVPMHINNFLTFNFKMRALVFLKNFK